VKAFFLYLIGMMVLMAFSTPAFSHAGPHENKNCFITVETDTLRFSGYQFQGLHPDQSYCRIFPYQGSLVIKIEPVNNELKNKKVSLELFKVDSLVCLIFRSCPAFSSLKKTPWQSFNHGVVMIQTDIQQRGIYALGIALEIDDKETIYESYLFLAGIPVTKLLVLFSMGLLGVLALFMAVKNRRKKRLTNPKPASVNQN
jgi:hypothetical protein